MPILKLYDFEVGVFFHKRTYINTQKNEAPALQGLHST